MTDADALIDRVLDGTATADEAADLHRRLAVDPAVRRDWWAATALRAQLAGLRPARVRRRRTAAVAIAAAAVLVLAVGFAVLATGPDGTGPAGPPRIVGGSVLAGAAAGDPLPTGRRLTVADLVIDLADGSRLAMDGRAEVELARADGAGLRLHEGRITARIAPRPAGDPLRISTDQGEVTVLGTRFTLDARAGATVLQVAEGAVEIADRRGRRSTVAAGQAAWADAAGLARRTRIAWPSATAPLAGLLADLAAGDALLLADGDHRSGLDGHPALRVAAAGDGAEPVRIAALPGHRPRIRAGGWIGLDVAAGNVVLRDLALVGDGAGEADGQGTGLRIRGARKVAAEGLDIADFGGSGLHIEDADGVSVARSRIHGNGGRSPFGQGGIAIHGDSTGVRLVDLTVDGNRLGPANRATGTLTGGHGILIDGVRPAGTDPIPVQIVGCRFVDNAGPGISIHASRGVAVRDGTVAGNATAPGHASPAQILVVDAAGITLHGLRVVAAPGTVPLARHQDAEVRGDGNRWEGAGPAPADLGDPAP